MKDTLVVRAILGGLGVAGVLFGIAAEKLGKAWGEMIDDDLGACADDEVVVERDDYAKALVPEYAAAALARARLRPGCGCDACRRRAATEPCSDFDE